jgi:hypothetical protein
MPLGEITPEQAAFRRIMIYGNPKGGKSRVATSLPDHYGEILYYAADPGSESLAPILNKYRPRIHVIKSLPSVAGQMPDPDADAFTFALNDWSQKYPLAKTIVWDTLTQTSQDMLQFIADTGQFSETKHIPIGSGAYKQNIPLPGDYRAAQERLDRLVTYLFRMPYHLIVICHAEYDAPVGGEEAEGGPKTVGRATIRKFAGRFDEVFYTKSQTIPPKVFGQPSTTKFVVYTEKYKIWVAGIRGGLEVNPMPYVELNPDPINFWEIHEKHFPLKESS